MTPRNASRMFETMFNNVSSTGTRSADVIPIFYIGEVIDHKDPLKSRRVKVKIYGIDDPLSPETIPWSKSILPEFFFMIPLVGERVVVLLKDPWDYQSERYYIGPNNFLGKI